MAANVCKKCGSTEFYKNGKCKACQKVYQNEWTKRNPERRAMINDKWAKNNPEKLRECRRKYAKNNPQKAKDWKANNLDKFKEYQRKYESKNKERRRVWQKGYRNRKRLQRQRRINACLYVMINHYTALAKVRHCAPATLPDNDELTLCQA